MNFALCNIALPFEIFRIFPIFWSHKTFGTSDNSFTFAKEALKENLHFIINSRLKHILIHLRKKSFGIADLEPFRT